MNGFMNSLGTSSSFLRSRAPARTSSFFSSVDGVASCAPRSNLTFFVEEALLLLESEDGGGGGGGEGGSCSPEDVDRR